MRVLGLISGTSHDGIDCALVDFAHHGGVLSAVIEETRTVPYSARLCSQLMAALPPAEVSLGAVTELDTRIGQEFSGAASAVLSGHQAELICSHGQTVYHWVDQGTVRGSLQLGCPAWIAERTGVPVLSDVRSRDIAAGGQGAPLVPVLDHLLLGGEAGPSAALNLGGIANVTVLHDGGEPVAYDVGPANALIDAAVRMTGAHPDGYDQGGELAAAGTVDQALLRELLAEPYYAARVPKSTGKELFNEAYVQGFLARSGVSMRPEDLMATLTELTVRTVVDALGTAAVKKVVASGGGTVNPVIMEGIRRGLPGVRVVSSEHYGVPAEAKEALAFALIGWLSWHGLPAALSSATGARQSRILGTLSPGAEPLRLPQPLTAMPSALRVESV